MSQSSELHLQVSPDERVIVVMGPTGSGKSTFIEYATRQDGQTVGHTLRSFTTDIRAVRVIHPIGGYPVLLVDTPGFDDTYRSDVVILVQIADFLVKIYKGHFDLASIVYLHKISDNRMTGSVLKNLRIFISLCGQKAMPSVVCATTMWSEVPKVKAVEREKELKDDFWKEMVAAGCKVHRFKDTYNSAWGIIGDGTERDQTAVLLQLEVVEDRLRLNETHAGKTLNEELERLIKDRQNAARMLEDEAKKQNNELVVNELNGQKAQIDDNIIRVADQIRLLKISLGRRIALFFKKKRNA